VALRRGAPAGDQSATELVVGRIGVDLVHHMATLDGEALDLTAKEFRPTRLPGPPRREGLHAPDDPEGGLGDRLRSEAHYLRVYAHRLRRKLGDAGRLLHTQPGIGYELLEE